MERSDRIPLPAAEDRCSAAVCPVRIRCARAMAAILQGSPVRDYSVEAGSGTVLCIGFMSLSMARGLAEQRPARQAKPWPTGD